MLKEKKRTASSEAFIREMFSKLHDNVRVFIAEKDGERLSGIVCLHYRNEVYAWMGTPKAKVKISGKLIYPNQLLYSESIKWAIENGFKFCEITGADNLAYFDFKRKFGGELTNYFTARKYSPSFLEALPDAWERLKFRF